MEKVNLTEKFLQLTEHYSPKIAGELNGKSILPEPDHEFHESPPCAYPLAGNLGACIVLGRQSKTPVELYSMAMGGIVAKS